MTRCTAIIAMSSMLIALVVEAASDAVEKKATTLPEFSLEKPAVGLEMEVSPIKASFKVGDRIGYWCTIKNTSDGTKPVGWDPLSKDFVLHSGSEVAPGGSMCEASLRIENAIPVRSTPALPRGYTLFLPPKAQLVFYVYIGQAEKPEAFKGRFHYDPLPRFGGGPYGTGAGVQERYVFSDVFEYDVVAAGR